MNVCFLSSYSSYKLYYLQFYGSIYKCEKYFVVLLIILPLSICFCYHFLKCVLFVFVCLVIFKNL